MPVQLTDEPKKKVCFGLAPLPPGLGPETMMATLRSSHPRTDTERLSAGKHPSPERPAKCSRSLLARARLASALLPGTRETTSHSLFAVTLGSQDHVVADDRSPLPGLATNLPHSSHSLPLSRAAMCQQEPNPQSAPAESPEESCPATWDSIL